MMAKAAKEMFPEECLAGSYETAHRVFSEYTLVEISI